MNTDVAKRDAREIAYDAGNKTTIRLNPTIVRKYLVSGRSELVTDTEIVLFMQFCRFHRANPYLRQAYLIKYSSSSPASIVTGKDFFTTRAVEIPECAGYNAGIIVRRKRGAEQETAKRLGAVVYDGEELIGGWARAFRKGWQEAVELEVGVKEYMRFNAKGEPTQSWKTMPATMVRKVALVQVLREAFPEVFGGAYAPEEMPIDDSMLPTQPIPIADVETVLADPEPEPEDDTPAEVMQGASRAFDESGELPSADSDTGPELF